MAEAEQIGLDELFTESFFNIPDYQRNYAWDDQQFTDLIEDLNYLIWRQQKSENESDQLAPSPGIHYFGEVLLQKTGSVQEGANTFTEYDVIDGQQRLITTSILIRTILEELEDCEVERSESIEDALNTVSNVFIRHEGRFRVKPSDSDRDIFENLVEPDIEVEESDLSLPSHERMHEAKQRFHSYLQGEDDGDDESYDEFLRSVLTVLHEVFQVTTFEIEGTREAGRFFETKNDRGRDLSIKDRVKSYLIFCADNLQNEALSKDVYRRFKQVTESIAEVGSDTDVDSFLDAHWRIFTGDEIYDRGSSGITDLHRQLKRVPNYARIDRDQEQLEDWITAYLESLQSTSQSYAKVMYPEELAERTEVSSEYTEKLTQIQVCDPSSNSAGLLMAAHNEFGFSDKFMEILDLLEKFSYRSYQVSGATARAQRRKMHRLGNRILWVENRGTLEEITSVEADDLQDHSRKKDLPKREPYENPEAGFRDICDQLESAIGAYGSRTLFESRLRRADIVNGGDEDDNWNGFESNALSYFLREYESEAREDSFLGNVADLSSWRKNVKSTKLWVIDKESVDDAELRSYEGVENTLGNFVPTEGEYYDRDPADTYSEEYEDVFGAQAAIREYDTEDVTAGPFETLTHEYLPVPGTEDDEVEELSADLIDDQTEKKVEFALDRWGVSSRAIVVVEDWDDLDRPRSEAEREIARDVRNEYAGVTGKRNYNIPNVVVEDEPPSGDQWAVRDPEGELDELTDIAIKVSEDDGTLVYESMEGEQTYSVPPYALLREYGSGPESDSEE